MLSDEAVDNLR
jgi:hypothetical protein